MAEQITAVATCVLGLTSIVGIGIALVTFFRQKKDTEQTVALQFALLVMNFQFQRKSLFWQTVGSSTHMD